MGLAARLLEHPADSDEMDRPLEWPSRLIWRSGEAPATRRPWRDRYRDLSLADLCRVIASGADV